MPEVAAFTIQRSWCELQSYTRTTEIISSSGECMRTELGPLNRTLTWIAILAAIAITIIGFLVLFARIYPGLMPHAGFVLVLIGAVASTVAAFSGLWRATSVKHLTPTDFLPEEAPKSAVFLSNYGINGTVTPSLASLSDEIQDLRKEIVSLKRESTDAKAFMMRRMDVILAVLRHHREVLVPTELASTAGVVFLSSLVTIIGSFLLAFPQGSQSVLEDVTNSILFLIDRLASSI